MLLAKEPRLGAHLRSPWADFLTLSGRRSWGGGMAPMPNPLSFEALHAFGVRSGIVGDAWDRWLALMIEMDGEYLAYAAAEQQRQASAAKVKGR